MRISFSICLQIGIVLLAIWLAIAAQRDARTSDMFASREKRVGASMDKQHTRSAEVSYDIAQQ